jgi:DNA modification methylase
MSGRHLRNQHCPSRYSVGRSCSLFTMMDSSGNEHRLFAAPPSGSNSSAARDSSPLAHLSSVLVKLRGRSHPTFSMGKSTWFEADCIEWLADRTPCSIHGVVTDPPYGMVEYRPEQLAKRENGNGGVWRIPPSFDGHTRSPLPRFTVLTDAQLEELHAFFFTWASVLEPALVPGAHILIATNPLLAHIVASAIHRAGYEQRGQVIRLVQTMRGGDRPKGAHEEFRDVSVMPRSQHEPWLLFRKPLENRVQDNLRKWGTGGLRRISDQQPFGDVIPCRPTRREERVLAPHPSLKPQEFLRQVVRAILPLGKGTVCDTFAGSGSTLAAAEWCGYESIGIERDAHNTKMARTAIPALTAYKADADIKPDTGIQIRAYAVDTSITP